MLPHLRGLPGHRGAYLLERAVGGEVEFTAMTLWDSIEVIRSFTGRDPTVAVVEPTARTMLARFDEFATHYDAAAFPMGWASTP